jgi:hypothetical protein
MIFVTIEELNEGNDNLNIIIFSSVTLEEELFSVTIM